MAKKKLFTIDVEEIKRYQIEVEAKNAKEAAKLAHAKFFENADPYEYMNDVNFDDPEEVTE